MTPKPSGETEYAPVTEPLWMLVQRAWDDEFTRPGNTGVDARQAQIAVRAITEALARRIGNVIDPDQDGPTLRVAVMAYIRGAS
jgi:hypothetical protein